ncbi:hypothetical protein A1507_18725 [Methylomonas koyamae]|uniref:Uncharacterized protein n=1 Tax=Methylomonas koyamae TaxID=702114 RepID=A0A177N4I0_9GAMM|nr:hypothetical protein [Methylomonas koyamae]OAI12802.1 hypothetical protein A1507_18725 [Methylomonas koyamae]
MSLHVEWTQGIGRTFDPGKTYENSDPFVSVVKIDKIGPDTVLLSADLSQRKLTRSDIADLKRELVACGFEFVHCWRKIGRKVPYGGKVIRTRGNLALWEIEL